MRYKTIILGLFFAFAYIHSQAQINVYNIAEYQLGNIPGNEPNDASSIYEQLNVSYKWKWLKASARFENFYSTESFRNQYSTVTQYSLTFRKKGLTVKAGNFYETLGKGLLYRGYEIKNSVFEDQIYRTRQGFYRDTRGASVSYSNKSLTIKALHGKTLNNLLPPINSENRVDVVSGGEISGRFLKQRAGIIYLDTKSPAGRYNYLSSFLEGQLSKNLDYYIEFSHQINNQQFFRLNDKNSYGGYLSINYSVPRFGLSFELKDYHNLFIGSGISDPPTLVKEHSYRLLNRSTHITNLTDESGLQLEVFYQPSPKHLITINHARAVNDFSTIKFNFYEYFIDWHIELNKSSRLKLFADYSLDEVVSEKNRISAGAYYTRLLKNSWSVSVETEFQQITKSFGESNKFNNVYAGFILSKSTKFSTALICEFTNDPVVADLSGTTKIETKQLYPGVLLNYKPDNKNSFQLFAGNRRGGPACTSGICYEVLDFKGVELRWTLRL